MVRGGRQLVSLEKPAKFHCFQLKIFTFMEYSTPRAGSRKEDRCGRGFQLKNESTLEEYEGRFILDFDALCDI